ncbi:MAG: hypothetical protein ACUVSF_11245 [Anaerolineae bacterium]
MIAVHPQQALVLQGRGIPSAADLHSSWVFFLAERPEGTTRLLVRYRMSYRPDVLNRVMWEGIIDPVFFIMERRMLLSIRQRAEAARVTQGALARNETLP